MKVILCILIVYIIGCYLKMSYDHKKWMKKNEK